MEGEGTHIYECPPMAGPVLRDLYAEEIIRPYSKALKTGQGSLEKLPRLLDYARLELKTSVPGPQFKLSKSW